METLNVKMMKVQEVIDYPVEEIEFEDTSDQRFLNTDKPKVTWEVTTPVLTDAEAQALRNFYAARRGSFEAFQWLSPLDGVLLTVRFKKNSLVINDNNSYNWGARFSLVTTAG